jgi:NAD+ diphosphatase
MKFVKEIMPVKKRGGKCFWCIVSNGKILLRRSSGKPSLPQVGSLEEMGLSPQRKIYLGRLEQRPCYAVEVDPDLPLPEDAFLVTLRELFHELEEPLISVLSHAVQILHWDETNRFCSRCGTQMENSDTERAKVCPSCGFTAFPRISPAIIVAIRRDRQILLIRAHRHRAGVYSNVAGYVEVGESLEECVRREIREEVGLEVTNLKYFGSQSWPFPHSLMVGFTAEYLSGELRRDESEIVDAKWFSIGQLPQVPEAFTISRRLIDSMIGRISAERIG